MTNVSLCQSMNTEWWMIHMGSIYHFLSVTSVCPVAVAVPVDCGSLEMFCWNKTQKLFIIQVLQFETVWKL